MPVLILLLAIGVFGYLYWRRKTTTLTRNCRWRLHKAEAQWRCAFCGATTASVAEPRACLRE